MTIKTKILATVLPLIIIPLLFISLVTTQQAKIGITKIAQQLLSIKLEDLYKKISSQYDILQSTGLLSDKDLLNRSYEDIEQYMKSMITSKTGYVQIISSAGEIILGSIDNGLTISEEDFFKKIKETQNGWIEYKNKKNELRVGAYLYFSAWGWYMLITESSASFYADAQTIQYQIGIIGLVTIFIIIILLLPITNTIINPIKALVQSIRDIVKTHDLKKKVPIVYKDEIGKLTSWFNAMTDELDTVYQAVKSYAYDAVIARDNEKNVRTIFQKYVPKEVVDQMLKIKEENSSMLIGAKQECSILFSDIRDFTTIAEKLGADELVSTLNSYFTTMVSIIIKNQGIIDKFIGDAIMAVFGAPVQRPDDTKNIVVSGFEMVKASKEFNQKLCEKGKTEFKIGIGISTGEVIAGNIGSEQKMDYTVIGDPVNSASRLEGLTKIYKVPIIISEYTYNKIHTLYPTRELDLVRVKGKQKPLAIYEPFESMTEELEALLSAYNTGITLYKQKQWEDAIDSFAKAYTLSKDGASAMYIDRCNHYKQTPPESDWDGVYVFKTK